MGRKIQIRTAHRCASKVAAGASAPSALRYPKRTSRCSLARSFRPLRVLRLAASATGGARLRTPYPSPVAGEGPSGQITACSNFRLGIMPSCYWFAVVPNKIRRRHLESVSAAPYGSTFQLSLKSPIRIQPQLKRYGVLGHSPKRVLVWGPRRDARPAGERRSGGALEGYPKRKRGDPTWSAARDDAHE